MPGRKKNKPSLPMVRLILAVRHSNSVGEFCGRTLARKLKRRGTTASREISVMRKTRAGQLLRETDRSIAEIAAGIGYLDPVVFSRAFKRWTGFSPRDFRKKVVR